jgi:hypothetical protein
MNTLGKGCGLGCLIFVLIYLSFGVLVLIERDNDVKSSPSSIQKRKEKSFQSELTEEDKQYLDNSLSTGETPYSQYYGNNYKCPYDQCSGINVTAPQGSDIVVIIKRGSQKGKVVAHGYIRSGASYQFDLPDGTYQTFFYYGRGWSPNKVMKDGIKGGFLQDEIFSKDNPQKIFRGVLSYILQLQRNGNFQTKESNAAEAF